MHLATMYNHCRMNDYPHWSKTTIQDKQWLHMVWQRLQQALIQRVGARLAFSGI